MTVRPGSKEVNQLRRAIAEGLPEVDHAGINPQQAPASTYVPPAHAQALDPERCVVEGIRGAGKSFWWAALSSQPHRQFVAKAFPDVHLDPSMTIRQGFGDVPGPDAPSKDVLASLHREFKSARPIWRAVVAHLLEFPAPFPRQAGKDRDLWANRTAWVSQNPESFDHLLVAADSRLHKAGRSTLLLFDALDRLAETWLDIRPLARGLLQVAQDMRATRAIRLKLFVRPDMLEDRDIVGFPDASKLLARRAQLIWRKVDLYALFFQCIGNAPAGGTAVRELTAKVLNLAWEQTDDSWLIPGELRSDEGYQERLFEKLAGKAMSSSPTGVKRGKPYKWVVNHLQDGRDQVSPRSFCEALRRAAQQSIDDFPGHDLPLHFKSIQTGVQAASRIRVDELVHEDYPWVEHVMAPLRGELQVPCPPKDIMALWNKSRALETLSSELQQSGSSVKLPPQHLADGSEGVLADLQKLGLIQRQHDGRIQMPDVYRIAFGLGRRGGVKPLK